MKLSVLNPGGNDREQAFGEFAGPVDPRLHPPVNYHGYAACTGGTFYRQASRIPENSNDVLLLLRWDLSLCLKTLVRLQAAGKKVAVSLKESGLFQFAEMVLPPRRIELFKAICTLANGCLSSTPELVPIYQNAGGQKVEFIPTPYPVEDPRWDFSVPLSDRAGIFIGTREFEVASRNHLATLLLAREIGEPATVINVEGRQGRKRLAALGCDSLRVIEGPLPYPEYLRIMARHRVVLQLDRSAVPGQVAGDALLCRTPCIGGDGAIERLVFTGLSQASGEDAAKHLRRLLKDDAFWSDTVTSAAVAAEHALSFHSIRARLARFFEAL